MTNKGKILAVDDTRVSFNILSNVLMGKGYEVPAAINGKLTLLFRTSVFSGGLTLISPM
jgi:PleD family two-component response regulator